MVGLSKPRSSQKPAAPKLSVPRPLNLPSLRKEHERFDRLGSGGGGHSGSGLGSGGRPSSSGFGWTKPAAVVAGPTRDNEVSTVGREHAVDIANDGQPPDQGLSNIANGAVSRSGGTVYTPPSARIVSPAFSAIVPDSTVANSAASILKGEDFPSLQASLPVNAGPQKKQEDLNQKQKLVPTQDYGIKQTIGSQSRTNVDMRPQSLSKNNVTSRLDENGGETHGLGRSVMLATEDRNQEAYFSGPLPLVRLQPRSDWADDERDTGHGLTDKGKDHVYYRSEADWDTDFDLPRPSVLPQKPIPFDRRGQRDNGATKLISGEVTRLDTYPRDTRMSSREGREGSSFSPRSKNDFSTRGVVNERNDVAWPPSQNRETKENKYVPSPHRESAQNDAWRKDAGYKQVGKQPWNNIDLSGKRGSEHSVGDFHGEQYNRKRVETRPSVAGSKSSFYLGGKGFSDNAPVLPFSCEKRSFLKSERSHVEDPFIKDFSISCFDEYDPFSGGLVGLVKKKKEVQKQTDFRDTVRESFEAELERVEKMQELERRRIIEEQEKAMELAHREEEERLRLVREEEERRRRLEEEAREAAWRIEQEQLEALRKAEEQRIAREEEKQKILMEEERRKLAAKQKLLELEEKIAKRQAETSKVTNNNPATFTDEKLPGIPADRDFMKVADVGVWEDNERTTDYFRQIKGQKWNISGDGGHYGRNIDIESESRDNNEGKIGDAGMGEGRSYANNYRRYGDRTYQNPEAEELYSFGRSRYAMRQPRVLPPPSMTSMHSSYRGFGANGMQHVVGSRNKLTMQTRLDSHQENLGLSNVDSQQGSNEIDAHTHDKNVAKCDSQSTLSLCSPPDSPGSLSHDDLGESGNSRLSTAAEVRDTSLMGQGGSSVVLPHEAGKPDTKSGSSFASSGDDEWTIENDEQLQEQEEYDEEEEDGYVEEDEIQDGEDEAVNLTLEYEGIHLDDKNSSEMVDNLILGFNEGVEVGMPNDEFDGSISTEESKFVAAETSMGAMEEQVLFSNIRNDGQTLQHDGHSQVSTHKCSVVPQEINRVKQDIVIQPEAASETPATLEAADNLESSSSSSLSMQSQVPSSSALTIMPPPPLPHGQPEIPVKLQFGLFSGPSLIPSPVPAIQIGSIQMPLHLHPPVAPSLGQMHTLQPPVFQFGQLRYTSAVSQGAVPLASQSVSFFQPDVSAALSSNQNNGGCIASQSTREASGHCLLKTDDLSTPITSKENPDNNAEMQNHCESGYRVGNSFAENFKPLPSRETESLDQAGESSSQSFSKERDLGVSKGQGLSSGGRGKRYPVTMRTAHLDSNGLQGRYRRQRTEFRVRNNSERKQPVELVSSSRHVSDDKPSISSWGIAARRGSRRTAPTNRQPKETLESDGLVSRETSGDIESNSRSEKGGKDSLRRNKNISHPAEDVDASLQSGIVQIFEQPGIEAPSDDDDFIEVRSKRQMLNDRREQREKENKAKSQRPKYMPRRARSSQNVSFASSKVVASVNVEASNKIHSEFVSSDAHGFSNVEVSTGFISPVVAQTLPPIGSPPLKDDTRSTAMSQTIKSSETSSSCGGKNMQPGIVFENKDNALNNIQTSMASRSNPPIQHRDMSLSQKQLDKIIKPGEVGTHSMVSDALDKVSEPALLSSSILTEDKSFSSTASPISSLLAGEKIQFGAVTCPSILPNSSCVSHGIVPPGSCHSRAQVSNEVLSAADNSCSLLLGKEKKSSESCANLEDCESEAEAAASAIAVAAITSDEIIGNDLGTGSSSCAEVKTFGSSDISGVKAGVSPDQSLSTQSRAEESLTVALPADLSVETSISLWPHLPSPQNANNQMLSHVTGGLHSQFPFYEMNPMLGGSSYAYGPLDESSSTESQSQKSNASVSGSLGSWHPHSGLDSFYGRPSGFTGPFISPPGTIPGVQGPPHMVVYNHFAPVGQFGQVGLSFMGTTYVPSEKQPDWKHNPSPSAMGIGEGDLKNLNAVSSQRNPTNMPTPVQHLAPRSPLLPLGSPLAMYDVSLFQSSSDVSGQSCWSHIPSSSVHSLPTSVPLQQQSENVLPSQLKVPAVDQPLTAKMYAESQTTSSTENSKHFPLTSDGASTQLPDELGLASSTVANTGPTMGQSTVASLPSAATTDVGKKRANQYGGGNNGSTQNNSSSFSSHSVHHKNASAHSFGNSSGYNYQRGGTQKNGSGAEWSNRRTVYQVRNQSLGGERSFASSKMKQIYVAKQTSGSSRGSGGA